MKSKTRFIALTAMFAAFATVFLYISSVIPTGQLGFVALAALFGIAAVVEGGIKSGIAVYIISSLLGFFLLPNKSPLLLYVLFFGYYPILKYFAERPRSRVLEWVIKLVVENAALTVILFLFSAVVYDFLDIDRSKLLIYLIFNACYIIFDIGVTKVVGFYIAKISKRIK